MPVPFWALIFSMKKPVIGMQLSLGNLALFLWYTLNISREGA